MGEIVGNLNRNIINLNSINYHGFDLKKFKLNQVNLNNLYLNFNLSSSCNLNRYNNRNHTNPYNINLFNLINDAHLTSDCSSFHEDNYKTNDILQSDPINLLITKENWQIPLASYHHIPDNRHSNSVITMLSFAPLSLINQGQHNSLYLTSYLFVKILLLSLLFFTLVACHTLPEQPHIEQSIQLTHRLNDYYTEKKLTAINSPITGQATPADLADQQPISMVSDQLDSDKSVVNPPQSVTPLTQQATATYTDGMTPSIATPNVANVLDQSTTQPVESLASETEQYTSTNLSGYYPILTGANAFASRSVLTDLAEESIDIQYYIWHNDQAGQLLLKKLWQAAERGVIIRFLLDDFNNNSKLDKHLLRFASHPNIAVRLMNPMSFRKLQTLNYLTEFNRINNRMHNKSMTFDRSLSIVGGRNVGDEYLSNNQNNQFADLDVLLTGKVVTEVTNSFDQYWNSPLAYDVQTLVQIPSLSVTNNKSNKIDFIHNLDKIDPENLSDDNDADSLIVFTRALENSTIESDLIDKTLPFRWVPIKFVSDDVAKLNKTSAPQSHLVTQLRQLLGTPIDKLSIISSYFVPTKEGVDTLVQLAEQGVMISILTNSFDATDVAAVHAGYAPWRIPLLEAGIDIYELKAIASAEERENKLWRARSQSATSLHAKALAVDDAQVFIGSYNVDPRSANINTELGVVINDPNLAQKIHNTISDELLSQAYKLVLSDKGLLQWQTLEDNKFVIYEKEPEFSVTDAVWIKIMSYMPIDWLL